VKKIQILLLTTAIMISTYSTSFYKRAHRNNTLKQASLLLSKKAAESAIATATAIVTTVLVFAILGRILSKVNKPGEDSGSPFLTIRHDYGDDSKPFEIIKPREEKNEQAFKGQKCRLGIGSKSKNIRKTEKEELRKARIAHFTQKSKPSTNSE